MDHVRVISLWLLFSFAICVAAMLSQNRQVDTATHIKALIDQGCERLDVVRRPNGSPTTAVFRCPGVSRLVVIEKHSH
jgi:hypothetical protein